MSKELRNFSLALETELEDAGFSDAVLARIEKPRKLRRVLSFAIAVIAVSMLVGPLQEFFLAIGSDAFFVAEAWLGLISIVKSADVFAALVVAGTISFLVPSLDE